MKLMKLIIITMKKKKLNSYYPIYDIIEDENSSPEYEKKQCNTLEYTSFLNDRITLKI